MGISGPVDAVHKLSRHEVTNVLHGVRCGVSVVVATLSMVTKAVSVLHTQVQTLNIHQINEKVTNSLKYHHICWVENIYTAMIRIAVTNQSYLVLPNFYFCDKVV